VISLVAKGDKHMRETSLARWLAILLAASGILCWARSSTGSAAAAGVGQNATAPDPRLDMVKTLRAMGPHPSLGDQANVFGRFVGTWDVDYAFFSEDGKATHSSGELIVGWVMDGQALQDLFITYPTGTGEKGEIGTTLRYFDKESGKWHVTYVEPDLDTVVKLTGGQEGDRIVLYGDGRAGSKLRWSFNDIEDDSFTWRGERSRDGGKTWRLDQEYHMKRRTSASDPRLDMVKALQAMGPDPSLGDQANVFGRFVGTWDAEYTMFMNGKAIHSSGQVIMGWVLGGQALQDVFINDPAGPGKERHMGTTLRYFDKKSGKWHITYIDPRSGTAAELTGGQEGDRIVLRTHDDTDGSDDRWSFNDIRPDSFVWHSETSYDGGKTWKLVEEHHMTRRTTATAKR
jgi:hypothetical protein